LVVNLAFLRLSKSASTAVISPKFSPWLQNEKQSKNNTNKIKLIIV
jgi:hypothetical protein